MKKNTWNFILGGILLFLFAGLVWTGLLIHYVLPPRHGRFRDMELLLWGRDRHDYGAVHFYLAMTAIALLIVHVWLHWSWVCGTIKRFLGRAQVVYSRRMTYGVVFLLILTTGLAGSLMWASSEVTNVAMAVSYTHLRAHET